MKKGTTKDKPMVRARRLTDDDVASIVREQEEIRREFQATLRRMWTITDEERRAISR